jgi:hypothetical protein
VLDVGVTPAGTWEQVAGTYDGRTVRAILNGREVCRRERQGGFEVDTTPNVIGGNANDATDAAQELLAGALDELSVYDRALSAEEIEAVGAGGACAVQAAPPALAVPGILLAEEQGTSGRATVAYEVTAHDPITGEAASSICAPASGSSFPLGTTAVECTATGAAGRSNRASFPVVVSPARRRPRTALLVVGPLPLDAADAAVRQRLEASGYTVTPRTAASVTAADAIPHRLVVISSSVSSVDLNTRLTNVRVPLLVMEPALFGCHSGRPRHADGGARGALRATDAHRAVRLAAHRGLPAKFEGTFVGETYSFFPYVPCELILPCTNDELVLYDERTSVRAPERLFVAGFDVGRTRDRSELAVFEETDGRFTARMLRSFEGTPFVEQEAELRRLLGTPPSRGSPLIGAASA